LWPFMKIRPFLDKNKSRTKPIYLMWSNIDCNLLSLSNADVLSFIKIDFSHCSSL
jgi:hypothetical protein